MHDRCRHPASVDAQRSVRRQRHGSPHLRRVLTRLLFLSCFGIGDFSILRGRHALASPRAELDSKSASSTQVRASASPRP